MLEVVHLLGDVALCGVLPLQLEPAADGAEDRGRRGRQPPGLDELVGKRGEDADLVVEDPGHVARRTPLPAVREELAIVVVVGGQDDGAGLRAGR